MRKPKCFFVSMLAPRSCLIARRCPIMCHSVNTELCANHCVLDAIGRAGRMIGVKLLPSGLFLPLWRDNRTGSPSLSFHTHPASLSAPLFDISWFLQLCLHTYKVCLYLMNTSFHWTESLAVIRFPDGCFGVLAKRHS